MALGSRLVALANIIKFRRRVIANKAQKGMSNSSKSNSKSAVYLQKARQTAYKLAKQKGFVTSDDVVNVVGMPSSPSVIGALFKDNNYVRVGYTPSTRKGTHGREIGVWRLKSNIS